MIKPLGYDSFGNVLEDTNPALAVPFGFAGGLYDADTGLLRFGFRDYAPDTGRWTAKDPIGFAGGDTDLYGYCVGDPIGLTDQYGLTSIFVNVSKGILKVVPSKGDGPQYSVPFTSGKGMCMNNTACEDKQNEGPIPQGQYHIIVSEIENPWFGLDIWDNFKNGDWGDWRAPLHPQPGTEMFGRCGTYLHGGNLKGSSGCIDIGGGLFGNELTDQVLRDIENDPDGKVYLYVR